MRTAWGGTTAGRSPAVPVEMRFIDMFMAALGALVFMAMLLAFLLKYLPKENGHPTANGHVDGRFRILTRLAPAARQGESYELALAYRGGEPPVRWELLGENALPSGLTFDPRAGLLQGTPGAAQVARFVVRARDAAGASAEVPFELTIEAAKGGRRGVERWLAGAMLALLTLLWLGLVGTTIVLRQQLSQLQGAWDQGLPAVEFEVGRGVLERIDLPAGIHTYRSRLQGARAFAVGTFLAILALGGWFAWRLWRG